MGKASNVRQKKYFLIISLVANLGLLFAFKYFNFFSKTVSLLAGNFSLSYQMPVLKVLLPVGISFYTFQTLSYTIDVYKGVREPEHHFGKFALYVAFFPQLVAGPIERSTRLLPQFFKKHDFNYQKVIDGMQLMLWGMFKKVVIADRLAILVDKVYNNPYEHNGIVLILATYFFAINIFYVIVVFKKLFVNRSSYFSNFCW